MLFAGDGEGDFLIALKPEKTVTVIFLGEAGVLAPLVLDDALVKGTCNADVEGAAATGMM